VSKFYIGAEYLQLVIANKMKCYLLKQAAISNFVSYNFTVFYQLMNFFNSIFGLKSNKKTNYSGRCNDARQCI